MTSNLLREMRIPQETAENQSKSVPKCTDIDIYELILKIKEQLFPGMTDMLTLTRTFLKRASW